MTNPAHRSGRRRPYRSGCAIEYLEKDEITRLLHRLFIPQERHLAQHRPSVMLDHSVRTGTAVLHHNTYPARESNIRISVLGEVGT